MHSSEISRDRGSLENGSRIEFLLFVDQFHRHMVALHPLLAVSIRIFIARFRCIAQNADKSHYPETTAALERAAYLASA